MSRFYFDDLPAETWPTTDQRFPEWHPFIAHAMKVAARYEAWDARNNRDERVTDDAEGFFELAWNSYLDESYYQFYVRVVDEVHRVTDWPAGCSRHGDSPGMPGYGTVMTVLHSRITFGYDWINCGIGETPSEFFIQWESDDQRLMDWILIPVSDVTLELVVAGIQHFIAKHPTQYNNEG